MEHDPGTRNPEEEPTVEIFITKRDRQRLDGDERYGKWYEKIEFSKRPSKRYCIKTSVPDYSVEDGTFDPSMSEPDMVVELCEEVSSKEIAKEQRKLAKIEAQNVPSVKKGQIVWWSMNGAGVTSYEESIVGKVSKKKGIFYLDNGEGNDPSGPYYIRNGRPVDEEADRMLNVRVEILFTKPKDYQPPE